MIRFVRFNVVGAFGTAVQLAALWILADVAHVNYVLATTVAVGLAVAHNFVWHWWWTWRDRAETGGISGTFVRFALTNGALSLAGNLGVMAALISAAHLDPVVANAVAIGVFGLLNFWMGDEVVFRRPGQAAVPAVMRLSLRHHASVCRRPSSSETIGE